MRELRFPPPTSMRRLARKGDFLMLRDRRSFPIFVLATSAIVMMTVLLSQYLGGLAPCELCLYERWPWDAAIVISFIAAMAGNRPAVPWIALLLAGVFAVGGALAFYHVGVEQHWFAGPQACTAGATPASLEALKSQLLHQQPVRCDQPAWTLSGVSLAGWNLLASLIMAGISIVVFVGIPGERRAPAAGGAK
jgi:disulfide bond formation protein DsbB